jgi:hypothetical protein
VQVAALVLTDLLAARLFVLVWVFAPNRLGNDPLARAKGSDSAYASVAPVFSTPLTSAVVGGLAAVLMGGPSTSHRCWRRRASPASAGIAGVAVGVAAKDTVANCFGGLAPYFDRTDRVGDHVGVESGDQDHRRRGRHQLDDADDLRRGDRHGAERGAAGGPREAGRRTRQAGNDPLGQARPTDRRHPSATSRHSYWRGLPPNSVFSGWRPSEE